MQTGLTPQEYRCVWLAGDGLTNKEIRKRLAIGSERTVERHLANAYQKLGVSNRMDAAAFLRTDYADQPIPIPPPPLPRTTREVTTTGFVAAESSVERPRSLFDLYSRLGPWRTPRPIGGSMLPMMLVFALVGSILATAFFGLLSATYGSGNQVAERLVVTRNGDQK